MKLYCVKIQYQDKTMTSDNGLDVIHVLANGSKEVYTRLDKHKKECEKYGYLIEGYSFFHVYEVDDLDMDQALNRYEKVDEHIV